MERLNRVEIEKGVHEASKIGTRESDHRLPIGRRDVFMVICWWRFTIEGLGKVFAGSAAVRFARDFHVAATCAYDVNVDIIPTGRGRASVKNRKRKKEGIKREMARNRYESLTGGILFTRSTLYLEFPTSSFCSPRKRLFSVANPSKVVTTANGVWILIWLDAASVSRLFIPHNQ